MTKPYKPKPTKRQFQHLLNCGIGVGFLCLHNTDKEVLTIEVYIGRDGTMRRVANGEPLLPLAVFDGEEGKIICQRAARKETPEHGDPPQLHVASGADVLHVNARVKVSPFGPPDPRSTCGNLSFSPPHK